MSSICTRQVLTVPKEIYEEDALIHKLVDFITGEELLAIGDEESLTRLRRELNRKRLV